MKSVEIQKNSIMIPLPRDSQLIFWGASFWCFSYKYIFKTWDYKMHVLLFSIYYSINISQHYPLIILFFTPFLIMRFFLSLQNILFMTVPWFVQSPVVRYLCLSAMYLHRFLIISLGYSSRGETTAWEHFQNPWYVLSNLRS